MKEQEGDAHAPWRKSCDIGRAMTVWNSTPFFRKSTSGGLSFHYSLALLRPQPSLLASDTSIHVLADPERLTTVFEHLIRNAQDATADNGWIETGVSVFNELAFISISDTGEGMSPEFIRERLFRPFDSTKGSHAMGIRAYQARESRQR